MPIQFREEVQAELLSPWGLPVSPHPPHLPALGWLLVLLTLAAALWILSRSYADKVAVAGRTMSSHAPLEILGERGGRVADVWVTLGQRVTAGQPLLSVSAERGAETAPDRSRLEIEGLAAQLVRLSDQRDTYHALRVAELEMLEANQRGLARRMRVLEERGAVIQARVALAAERARRVDAASALSVADRDRAQRELLAERRIALDHRLDSLRTRDELQTVRRRLAIHHKETGLESDRMGAARAQLVTRMGEQKSRGIQVFRAPAPGYVADLGVQRGASVVGGQHLITLAQSNDAVDFELWLPSRGAGRVREGQSVRLRLAGFPHQEFGSVHARVRSIADASRTRKGESAYRLVATTVTRPAGVDRVPLGMAVSGTILLEERRLWRWLIEPLFSAWSRL